MTRFLVLATLILLVLPVLSCSCPPAPTLQRYPDWDFTTTEGCLEYFRMAAQDEDAYHILLCLSTDVKRRKNLDLATIHTFRERIIRQIEDQVGPIDDVVIGEPVIAPERPWLAQVRITSGDRSEVATLVKEVSAFVTYSDPDKEPEWILLPQGDDVATAARRHPQLARPDVYRVEYERGWRIDGVTNTTLRLDLDDSPKAP